MKLRINSIYYNRSIVDGPGVRTVIFLQGCTLKCEGCHNPDTWDTSKGIEIDVTELIKDLKLKCINKKITISGGEPLLQYNQVLSLVKQLNFFSIVLYTCYELDKVPSEILNYIDYIKVGAYQQKYRTTIIPFIGSSNQRFIKLDTRTN